MALWKAIRINVDGDSRRAVNARLSLQPGLLAQSIWGGRYCGFRFFETSRGKLFGADDAP